MFSTTKPTTEGFSLHAAEGAGAEHLSRSPEGVD